MTTSPITTITDELLAELESASNGAANEVFRSHGWQDTIDDIADDLLGLDEKYLRAANPATILALLQHVRELSKDRERLDAIEANCWDVRYNSSPNGDAGDSSIGIEIVGHWMDKPCERVVGENYSENLRAALDQAMKAGAYPPARPEYD